MNPYFTKDVEKMVGNIWTFSELGKLNFELVIKMSKVEKWIGMVSGPISTGGVGHVEGNLEVFQRTIDVLQAEGLPIYDQLPFERHMWRIAKAKNSSDDELLNEFYAPLLESGIIKRLYFIDGWESSYGATREHEIAISCYIPRIYLQRDFLEKHADILNAQIVKSGEEI